MAKYAKNINYDEVAKTQAANIMKQLQGNDLKSVRTVDNYEEQLKSVAKYCNKYLDCSLRDMTASQATQYLTDRAATLSQSTVNMDRNAIEIMMHHVTNKLSDERSLPVIKSEKNQNLKCRSYTTAQVNILANATNERNAISILIAHDAGLRAHELFTIARNGEREISDRPARQEKFSGRDNQIKYVVSGKGGLVREVSLPKDLADRLEVRRLDTPISKTDRGVNYKECKYDISAGKTFSSNFTRTSNRCFGYSSGAHGLRHSYAQERMHELQRLITRNDALEIVSQEMGHFRPEITEVYLR